MNQLIQFYPHFKHTHVLLMVLSFFLYNRRFWHRIRQPEKPFPIYLRVLPVLNDTLLLLSGVMMMHLAKWSPFGGTWWLGFKLLLLLMYILLGVLSLRQRARPVWGYAFYGAAMTVLMLMVWLAHCKLNTACFFVGSFN